MVKTAGWNQVRVPGHCFTIAEMTQTFTNANIRVVSVMVTP